MSDVMKDDVISDVIGMSCMMSGVMSLGGWSAESPRLCIMR